MKNKISLLAICFLIGASSCKKFLDTNPKDFISPKNYYETEEQLNTALTGVYFTLANQSLYSNNMLARLGLEADEGFCSNASELTGVAGYNVSASDSKVLAYWQALYVGINRANLLLENVGRPKMDEAKRDKIKGQALFLRAYFYFMLVSNFGDIPLVLKTPVTSSADDIQLPRTPASEIYAQILRDMEEASTLVDNIQAIGFGGRVSKSAVWGIMARVCLYMAGYPLNDHARYADAKKWAEKVMTEGGHELNISFQDIFTNYALDKYDIKESIWEVEFWGNNTAPYTSSGGMVGRNNGIRFNSGGDPSIGYSAGYLHPTAWMFRLYENTSTLYSNDLRRDWSIAPFSYSGNNTATKVYFAATSIYQRYAGKWRRELETLTPKADIRTPQNFPLLRFSDVLLMYAEAENAINGPTTEAVEAVNRVRRRGYGKYLNGIGNVSESIKSITVATQGTGYSTTNLPVVTITGDGIGATATAVVTGGKVTGITITNPGTKYKTAPVITISGVGSGATATAVLTTLNDADLSDAQTTDGEMLAKAIQDERSRELNFELLRKGDLIRWGIFMARMTACKNEVNSASSSVDRNNAVILYNNVTARDVIWPIPQYERGVNPKLSQNLGW